MRRQAFGERPKLGSDNAETFDTKGTGTIRRDETPSICTYLDPLAPFTIMASAARKNNFRIAV
jgi:hypothetical protein